MERIDSLDTLKGVALLFVVYIHTKPFFSSGGTEFLSFIIASISRIAVPAFFLTSGFLLSKKIVDQSDISFFKRQEKKIAKYYIMASFAYLLLIFPVMQLNKILGSQVVEKWVSLNILGLNGLINIIYIGKGVAPFLWFLPALFFSLAIVYLFQSAKNIKYLLAGSFVLHIVAILSNAYPIVVSPIPIEDTFFFGLFFTTTGFFIGKNEVKTWKSTKTYFLGAIGFGILNLVERLFISSTFLPQNVYYWDPYFWGPYSFFTAPMVICLFLYILNKPLLGENSIFNKYGKYTLQGYLLHPVVIGFYAGLSILFKELTGIGLIRTPAWNVLFFPLSFLTTMETAVWYREKRSKTKN